MEKIVYVCWMRKSNVWEGDWLSIEELAKMFKDQTLIYIWTGGVKHWQTSVWTGLFGWDQYDEPVAPWPDQYEGWDQGPDDDYVPEHEEWLGKE